MSTYTVSDPRKVTTKRIADMRIAGEKIAMITAYDYTMATLVDQAGIDIILVGTVPATSCRAMPPPSPSPSTT